MMDEVLTSFNSLPTPPGLHPQVSQYHSLTITSLTNPELTPRTKKLVKYDPGFFFKSPKVENGQDHPNRSCMLKSDKMKSVKNAKLEMGFQLPKAVKRLLLKSRLSYEQDTKAVGIGIAAVSVNKVPRNSSERKLMTSEGRCTRKSVPGRVSSARCGICSPDTARYKSPVKGAMEELIKMSDRKVLHFEGGEEKCSPEYDVVVRRACRLDQEEKCCNTPQMDCNMVEKTKTETVIDNVCKVVYHTKCSTLVENQCEQVKNQKFTTVDDTACKVLIAKKCEQDEKEQCSTATMKECHNEYENKVETIPRRDCKQVCGKIHHQECIDVARKECITSHKDRECKAVSKQICYDGGKFVDVPTMECNDVPKETCMEVVDRKAESCESVPSMECKDMNDQVEKKIPHEVCVDVPETTCTNIPTMECKDILREVCNSGVKETCMDIPSMSCKEVQRVDCKDVPVQSCHDVTREVCKEVPREEYSKVPREVSKKVKDKVYGVIDHKSCRPVPKDVCTNVTDQVPCEVCVDMARPLCEQEPSHVSKEVCVDIPEENCSEENFTVTIYKKEKQCMQVMVETRRTKREAIQPALRNTDARELFLLTDPDVQSLLTIKKSPISKDNDSIERKSGWKKPMGKLLGGSPVNSPKDLYEFEERNEVLEPFKSLKEKTNMCKDILYDILTCVVNKVRKDQELERIFQTVLEEDSTEEGLTDELNTAEIKLKRIFDSVFVDSETVEIRKKPKTSLNDIFEDVMKDEKVDIESSVDWLNLERMACSENCKTKKCSLIPKSVVNSIRSRLSNMKKSDLHSFLLQRLALQKEFGLNNSETAFSFNEYHFCHKSFQALFGISDYLLKTVVSEHKKGQSKFVHGNQGNLYSSQRRDAAIAFIHHFAQTHCENLPDRHCLQLPSYLDIKTMFGIYVERTKIPEERVCEREFYLIFNSFFGNSSRMLDSLPRIVFQPFHTHPVCNSCSRINDLRKRVNTEVDAKYAETRKRMHMCEIRRKYLKFTIRRELSIRYPDDYLHIGLDDMDQAKLQSPYFCQKTKELSNLLKLKNHLTGVIITNGKFENDRVYKVFVNNDQFTQGSNKTISIMFEILASVQTELKKLPRKLMIQSDNCGKDLKNQYVLAFYYLLVELDIFDEVLVSHMPPGHTHNDVDFCFGIIAQKLKKLNIPSFEALNIKSCRQFPLQIFFQCIVFR